MFRKEHAFESEIHESTIHERANSQSLKQRRRALLIGVELGIKRRNWESEHGERLTPGLERRAKE